MFVSVMPLFNESMNVHAYTFMAQKAKSYIENPPHEDPFDGGAHTLAFDLVNKLGFDALTDGRPMFIPIDNLILLLDLAKDCTAPTDKVIFLFDTRVEPQDMYIQRIDELKAKGFGVAIRNVKDFDTYQSIMRKMDYIFLDDSKYSMLEVKALVRKHFPKVKIVASGIETVKRFKMLQYAGFDLFEGKFYRLPVTKSTSNQITPLKVNYIQLLNTANDENFEIGDVADIVQKDAALAISLLKIVNGLKLASEITSIRQAAAMLGQTELRKWITTAVANKLYADRPNEITKLSLIRAKFSETLAPLFELGIHASELFLMGLFSVLDIALDLPMEKALDIVKVTGNIKSALVDSEGKFMPLLEFVKAYETANWQEVKRSIIVYNMDMDRLEKAYLETLIWYRNLISNI